MPHKTVLCCFAPNLLIYDGEQRDVVVRPQNTSTNFARYRFCTVWLRFFQGKSGRNQVLEVLGSKRKPDPLQQLKSFVGSLQQPVGSKIKVQYPARRYGRKPLQSHEAEKMSEREPCLTSAILGVEPFLKPSVLHGLLGSMRGG